MDEAMLKSGQFPNVAIMAGTDPAEVMREHGRADNGVEVDNGAEVDTREQLLNGIFGLKSEKTPEIARQDGVLNISDVQDTREKLEADAKTLLFEFGGYCATSREGLTDDVDVFIGDFTDLLDRQAAITRRETRQRWQDAPCVLDRENLMTIAKLTAERDALKEQINRFNVPKSEENAENGTSKGDINNFDVQNDSREKLEADIRAWHRDTPFATKPSVQTLLGWLDRQAAITRAECKNTLVHFAERLRLYQRGHDDAVRDMQAKVDELTADAKRWADAANEQRLVAMEQADLVRDLTAERDELRKNVQGFADRLSESEHQNWKLTAERDELQAKVDELNASWRKANDGWAEANAEAEQWRQKRDQLSRDLDAEHALVVQFEHDNEELRHANNTLRASVAGLKMTVEKLKDRMQPDGCDGCKLVDTLYERNENQRATIEKMRESFDATMHDLEQALDAARAHGL